MRILMNNFIFPLAMILLLTISFRNDASMLEDETTKPKTTTPLQEPDYKNDNCRYPYNPTPKKFIGVDKDRDVALFEGRKSDLNMFQRFIAAFWSKKK